MTQLSFIIPAYNASSTIVRALDSIYSLPLKTDEFEVIVVDDCSTDNTLEILQAYATKQPNLHILHQEQNHRQGAARNWGLNEAKGDYVMFVDADDTIARGIIGVLKFAEQKDLDMLFCFTAWENVQHQFVPRMYEIPEFLVVTGGEFAEKYYDEVCVGPWTYLWGREFLMRTNIPFIENRRMEDFDFVEQHIVKANKIAYCSEVIYNYFINHGSTVRTMSYDTVADWVHVCYRRWRFCDTLDSKYPNFVSKIDAQCRNFVSSSLSVRRLTRFTQSDVRKILNRIGEGELDYLYTKGGWGIFTRLCMKHRSVVLVFITLAHPTAALSRTVVRTIRKNIP